jgi:MFS family permease
MMTAGTIVHDSRDRSSASRDGSPAPTDSLLSRQLIVLYLCVFTEQSFPRAPPFSWLIPRVVSSSITPYLYFMVRSFDIVHREADVGYYLGFMCTVFYVFRTLSNPFWGWLSDKTSRRKPILLTGCLGGSFLTFLFGLSRNYSWV